MSLPRELRDQIYHHLWRATKLAINVQGLHLHALYNSPARHETPVSRPPPWLLTSKAILKEGIERLEFQGEIVLEARFSSSELRPSTTDVDIDTSTSPPKPSPLIDPARFRTLVLHSCSPEETFVLDQGPHRVAHQDHDGEFLRLLDPHIGALGQLARHLAACGNPPRVRALKLEFSDVDDKKRFPLAMSPLYGLAGCLPALRRVEFRVEEVVFPRQVLYPEQTVRWGLVAPDVWFAAFDDVVGELFRGGDWGGERGSFVDLEGGIAVDFLRAERERGDEDRVVDWVCV